MKKIISVITAAIISITDCCVFLPTHFTCSSATDEVLSFGEFSYTVNGEEISVDKYNGKSNKAEIPQIINGKKVTQIGANAFYCCNFLEQVTIPEGMETIGESAFENCTKLNEVVIPKTVQKIGQYAFGYENSGSIHTKKKNFFINCYEKTQGENYAEENNFSYQILEHTHQYNKIIQQKSPDCTHQGIIKYECIFCGDILEKKSPATGHKWKKIKTVKPTYTSNWIQHLPMHYL